MSLQKIANQRLVDEAYKHINKTKRKSLNKTGICCYGGIGCAFSPAVINDKVFLLKVS